MSSHFTGPLGVEPDVQFGGLGIERGGVGIEATRGMTDAITIHEDFNQRFAADTFGGASGFELGGGVLTDVGSPVADVIHMNRTGTVEEQYDSCLTLIAGTAADTGGNIQCSANPNALGSALSNVLWIPENDIATILDGTQWLFACRIGLISNDVTWDGKMFLGWAELGDTGILTAATGAITQPEGGPLIGWHVGESGLISGIAQRTVNTAYAEGVNRTTLFAAADWNSGLTPGKPVWFDLALRMTITDMSDDAANGHVEFASRRLNLYGSGGLAKQAPWTRHPTVLFNQTPNNDVQLVPTIEIANGPSELSQLKIDWWTFACSRVSYR